MARSSFPATQPPPPNASPPRGRPPPGAHGKGPAGTDRPRGPFCSTPTTNLSNAVTIWAVSRPKRVHFDSQTKIAAQRERRNLEELTRRAQGAGAGRGARPHPGRPARSPRPWLPGRREWYEQLLVPMDQISRAYLKAARTLVMDSECSIPRGPLSSWCWTACKP